MNLRPKEFRIQLLYECSCGTEYIVDYLKLKSDPKYYGDDCGICGKSLMLQCPISFTANFERLAQPTSRTSEVKRDISMVTEIWELVEPFGAKKNRVSQIIRDNKTLDKEDLIKKILSEL